jgi:hypothetical protein
MALERRSMLMLLVAAVVAGLMLALCSAAVGQSTQPVSAQPIRVAIDPYDPGAPVPQQFLGLSFEAAAISQIAQYTDRGDLVKLLRSLGPGVLRFGGITADENVAWTDAATPRPAWASSTIGPEQMHAIGVLARRSGWSVLLTVGLAHFEPIAAAHEVAAAHRALGPYLAAVEIGNEPNAYGNHGFRELPWIAQGYVEEVGEYREAIAALTPGVPIAGPDVSGSGAFAEWGGEEALAQRPALLTGHHYPLGCAQTPAPSIETLLSAVTREREARSLTTYLAVAHANGIPLRIDETNTVSCGGVAGVSDTFASALWATGYITQVMAAGVAGINLQGNPANCAGYTPLCGPNAAALAGGKLRAQPEWYALLLSRSLVGDRPLPSTISVEGSPGENTPAESAPAASTPAETAPGEGSPAKSSPDLVAASFAGPGHTLKVVLVNDEPQGTSPLELHLDVGAGLGAAEILRLTAPSPSATGDVLLAGRAVAANGSWSAPAGTPSVATHAGILALELPPSSAALVTVGPKAKPRSTTAPRRHHARARRTRYTRYTLRSDARGTHGVR